MGPRLSSLLVLVLCLGQAVHTQRGVLPTPSIRAEPGPVVPRGRPVTIVCQSPAWAEVFRLEDNNSSVYGDQTVTVPHVFNGTEARFHINAVSEDTAKSYRCLYRKGSAWSESSDILELKVADEDVSPPPTETTSEVTAPPTGVGSQNCPASQNPTVGNYVCIGLSGMVLVILVGILAEAWHSQHWSPQEAQG